MAKTRAHQWKRKTYVITFPSGNEAEVQRPSVMSLVMEDGNIPNSFYAAMFGTPGQNGEGMQINKLSQDEQVEYAKTMFYLADRVATDAFISPKVVDGEPDYDADEISVRDIPDNDKQFLLDWVMEGGEPADALKRFRAAQQKAGMGASSKK